MPLSSTQQAMLRRLGLRIQKELFEQKKTVEWLAEKSGVARSTLHEIIAGRSNPRIGTLHAIALALGYGDIQSFIVRIEGSRNNSNPRNKAQKPNLKNPVNRRISKMD